MKIADGKLAGRTVIVTGGASGIGRATCIRFAEEGANVVCADINLTGAENTVAFIAKAGGTAVACKCDVSQSQDAKNATDMAVQLFSNLHVLVNNAATWIADGSVVSIDEKDWNHSIAVNLTGTFLMSKYAIPAIAASGGGSVIHIGSDLGHVGRAGRAWYGAAKAGIIHLAKVMAIDHAQQGIRVNSVSPGPTATDRVVTRYGGAEQAQQQTGVQTVLNRLAQPDEIANAVLFLASDESSFITGADLLVDGGFVIR
jgi:NAD(P)-dependent dehydrogenase (short-subunit alcohol dehydrogenase family)